MSGEVRFAPRRRARHPAFGSRAVVRKHRGLRHEDGIPRAGRTRLADSCRPGCPWSAARYFAAQVYDEAAPTGPLTYFGNSGYEHIGKLRSPAVTVTDLPGALPPSTHCVMIATRS
jgi:hypothetical protein